MVVAIDGPSGSGKSSAAKRLAQRLRYLHLDTGAIYRAFTLRALRRGTALRDEAALAALVDEDAIRMDPREGGGETVFLDGADVTAEIRTPYVTGEVHWLANSGPVRERVTALVRRMARGRDVVVEGRDTTTVIFPSAEAKFYVDATPEERARRRGKELAARGTPLEHHELLAQIVERDRKDSTRAVAPLRRAPDAFYVEATRLGPEEVVDVLEAEVRRKAGEARRAPSAVGGNTA